MAWSGQAKLGRVWYGVDLFAAHSGCGRGTARRSIAGFGLVRQGTAWIYLTTNWGVVGARFGPARFGLFRQGGVWRGMDFFDV